jgi:hypothetical protein
MPMFTTIYLWLYSPCGPWPLFQFLSLRVSVASPWTGDQYVARPLPTYGFTFKYLHTDLIQILCLFIHQASARQEKHIGGPPH